MTDEELELLEKYASLDGTELGEWTNLLLRVRNNCSHAFSLDITDNVEKELALCYEVFKDGCKIVKETVPQPDKVYESLEWY